MAICRVGNVTVVLYSRDEHCPPHVHAVCEPEGWSARYRFSFVDDGVEFWDLSPTFPRKPPTKGRLGEIGEAVAGRLPQMRRRWAAVFGRLCLDNAYGVVTASGFRLVDGSEPRRSMLTQVVSAVYDPDAEVTTLTLSDGSRHRITLE